MSEQELSEEERKEIAYRNREIMPEDTVEIKFTVKNPLDRTVPVRMPAGEYKRFKKLVELFGGASSRTARCALEIERAVVSVYKRGGKLMVQEQDGTLKEFSLPRLFPKDKFPKKPSV